MADNLDSMRTRTTAIASLVAYAATAHAWPTSLNMIPIADILKHGQIYAHYTAVGTERRISTKITSYAGVLIGIGDRIEIGWDDDLEEGGAYWNGKVLLGEGENWALSMGYQALRKNESQSYLVGRYDPCDKLRLHFGWLEDGKSRALWGLDYQLCDDWKLYVDSISGRDGATWVGVNVAPPAWPGFDVTLFAGIPHTRADGYTWNVIVAWLTKF